jgi:3-dehydrosphinganine reductase
MPLLFQNQHALITGGSSGIGKATACQLAAQGANITIIARGADRLAAAKVEIKQARASAEQRVLTVVADVSDRAQAEAAVQQAVAQLGAPDIVMTSAGMVQPGLFRDLPVETFEKTAALNYLGTVYVLKAALPGMIERRRGQFVLISSGAGLVGVYGYTSYSPTKFALHGLAQALRAELKPDGIRVMVVYPPDTDTPQLAEENRTKLEETRRINGAAKVLQPEEVASAIVSGIQHNRFSITPGLEMSVLSRLGSLIEPAMNWYMDSVVRSVQRTRNQSSTAEDTKG